MYTMPASQFEALVVAALDALPDDFHAQLDNVEVVVEPWPDPATMQRVGVRHPAQLLGFYHGVPQTRRSHRYGLVLPDKISIYRQPILLHCNSWEEVAVTVQRVLRHEIAHHFGISDERLRELGAY